MKADFREKQETQWQQWLYHVTKRNRAVDPQFYTQQN